MRHHPGLRRQKDEVRCGYAGGRGYDGDQVKYSAAQEWDDGDFTAAMARLEVIVQNSNMLIGEVNKAFNLRIPRSK